MNPDNRPPPFVTERGRDLRIDLLRGYFVFAMIVDHVCGASPLWLVTGGNRFFAGAAEGFILTSGLVAGLVYGRLIKRDGLGRSLQKVLTRAFKLYLVTLALTLTLLPLSELLGLPWAQGVDTSNPLSLVVGILTLHRTYHLVDVMLLYTILFLLAPLAFVLMEQGKRWWVLAASWLLWALFQLWPEQAALPWPIAGNYLFSFSGWQVIFFTGLALGYGRAALPAPRPRTVRLWLALTGAALVGLIALYLAIGGPAAASLPSTHGLQALVGDLFFNKVAVRPGRLLASGITFTFLFLAATAFWGPVRRALGWLLLPLGQNALYAYTAHVALVALAAVALAPLRVPAAAAPWLNALVQAAAVALVWLGVRYQVLAPTPRTQPAYNLSPALFAALAGIAFSLMPSPASSSPAAAAQPVNRFGTPLPATAAQQVNRFGTPLPPTPSAAARSVSLLATAVPPTPAPSPERSGGPSPTPTPEPDPMQRVAEWVGEINGTLAERRFYSAALDRSMPYWVYLPPGYDAGERHYPVLYLLHGASGHRDEWIAFGAVEVADREMSAGTLAPMIIIMPQGDQQFWVNGVGGLRWGDYVTQDLVAEVDATLRSLPTPAARAIGGLSMGGFGALSLAFTHPETFGVVGAHTPSLHTESADVPFLGSGEAYARRDPVSLAVSAPGLEGLRIWIDIDEGDNWLARAQELHEALVQRGVDHLWQVFPGSHVGDYWISHVPDYLHFYAGALAAAS